MAGRSLEPRLIDITQAIELISQDMAGISLVAFQSNMRTRRMVERCIEIISEASRHLDDALKSRHPDIPWRKFAAIATSTRMLLPTSFGMS